MGTLDDLSQPFVEQPSPPRSSTQPVTDADERGQDYEGVGGDEYQRSVQYGKDRNARGLNRQDILDKLKGNPQAFRSLQHKTLPLSRSSQPHYMDP